MSVISDVSQAVIAVAAVVGVLGLRQTRKLRILAYEDAHEARYWELMERLSLAALQGGDPATEVCQEDERVARSYFRLVETQLNVRAAGWITDNTWEVWTKGIQAQMGRHPFRQTWDGVKNHPQAEHEFHRLRAFMAQNPQLDPCKKRWLRRWYRGLTGVNRR